MQLVINISLVNDAFDDPSEVERVLRQVVLKLAHRGYAEETSFDLKDINGNLVGSCKVEQ